MSKIDLTKFCRTDGPTGHYDITMPFIKGGWKYATDGVICVRIPAPGEPDTEPPTKIKFPPAETLPWRDGERIAWPEHDGRTEMHRCDTCNGGGHTVKCNDCDEARNEGGECPEDLDNACPHPFCPTCNGKCERPYPVDQNVGGVTIDGDNFTAIASLPSVEFVNDARPGSKMMIHFDGGQAILMTMQQSPQK